MRIRASVLIQRPIATVFAYLSTPERLPDWVSGVATAAGPTPDNVGEGVALELRVSAGPRPGQSSWEITAYTPPRSLALRQLDDGGRLEVRWTLEGTSAGATRVWLETDVRVESFFRPAACQVRELGVRQVEADLEVLRRRLEQEALGPPP